MIFHVVITVFSLLIHLALVENLKLSAKPEIVVVGEPFNITCKSARRTHKYTIVSGDDTIMETARDYNNKLHRIFDDVYPKRHDPNNLETSVTLIRKSSEISDKTKYTCKTFDLSEENELKKSVTISIGYRPGKIQISLRNQNGVVQSKFKRGNIITVSCTSEMASKPGTITLTIYKLVWISYIIKITNAAEQTSVERKLTADRPELYNGKNLKCVAKNKFGSTSATKLLVIEYAPTQRLIKANGYSNIKFAVKPGTPIQCTAMGNPEPTMKWSIFDKNLFLLNGSDVLVSKTDVKSGTKSNAECVAIQSGKVVKKKFIITIDKYANEARMNFGLPLGLMFGVLFILGVFFITWWRKRQRKNQECVVDLEQSGVNVQSKLAMEEIECIESSAAGTSAEPSQPMKSQDLPSYFTIDRGPQVCDQPLSCDTLDGDVDIAKLEATLKEIKLEKEKVLHFLGQVEQKLSHAERHLNHRTNVHKPGVLERAKNIKSKCELRIEELENHLEQLDAQIAALENQLKLGDSRNITHLNQ